MAESSKVIHVRNVGHEISEVKIKTLLLIVFNPFCFRLSLIVSSSCLSE